MGDVLTFTPRPKPANPVLEPLAGAALRASLEEAAQVALDAADRIIAVLDGMDGDADHEDDGDAEPSLAAPENTAGSQVVYMRGSDRDGEAETSEIEWEAQGIKKAPEPFTLPWDGRGNIIAAVGFLILDTLQLARC